MAIELVSANYIPAEITAGADFAKGAFIPKATLGGDACAFNAFKAIDYSVDPLAAVVIKADRVKINKDAGFTLAVGEKVYYNAAGAKATNVATDVPIGVCTKAAASGDLFVYSTFDGTLSAVALSELADVDATGVDDNDTLKYVQSTGKWTRVAV